MNDFQSYIDVFFRFNPIYFAILVIIIILFIIHIIFKYILIPQKFEHQKKEFELAQENIKLMSLFAEMDPDPILRIRKDGRIIYSNCAYVEQTKLSPLLGSNIHELVPELENVEYLIENNDSESFEITIDKMTYSVIIRGLRQYEFAQVYFHNITERINYERELKDFSRKLQLSIEEERKRIAKELHDGIGQNLSAVRLRTAKLVNESDIAHLHAELTDIKNVLFNSIIELKDISYKLKPRVLDEIGLQAALIALCNSFSRDSRIDGIMKIDPLKNKLNNEMETSLYRISQEALVNIQRHSKATEYSMNLFERSDKICLIITDNGQGFNTDHMVIKRGTEGSMGLLSMRERAESMGGCFHLESNPAEGTVLRIEIPLKVLNK